MPESKSSRPRGAPRKSIVVPMPAQISVSVRRRYHPHKHLEGPFVPQAAERHAELQQESNWSAVCCLKDFHQDPFEPDHTLIHHSSSDQAMQTERVASSLQCSLSTSASDLHPACINVIGWASARNRMMLRSQSRSLEGRPSQGKGGTEPEARQPCSDIIDLHWWA